MKYFLLFMLLALASRAQEIEWVKGIGGGFSEDATSIATDSNGNVYTTGIFMGTLDFDPSPAVYNLTSNGDYDVFVAKYDASGGLIWAKNFGGSLNDFSYSIKIDQLDKVYITGVFQGVADFDPSNGTYNLSSAGDTDIFITKLDNNGSLIWAKRLGGNNIDYSVSVTTDDFGNVFTVGYFRGTADFDPSNSNFNLTANINVYDIFICKLDTNGNFLWAKSIPSFYNDVVHSVTSDELGNIYTTGYFRGTVDFDPGSGVFNLSSVGIQNNDIFILKLDAQGNFVWAKRIGGSLQDFGQSILFDRGGDIVVTGIFMGTVDFDPNSGVYNLTSAGAYDGFVLKLNPDGNFIWAKRFGGSLWEYPFSIATDEFKNIYISGYYDGTTNLDTSGSNPYLLNSKGSYDAFVLKLNSVGDFLYAKSLGGNSLDKAASVVVDNSNNVYVFGIFYDNTATYLQNGTTMSLSNQGLYDVFLMKINQQVLPTTTLQTLCGENMTSLSQRIDFISVPNAQEYTFSVTNTITNATHEITTPNRYFRISDVPDSGFNMSFNVKAKVMVNGIYGPYGDVCQINTPVRYSQLRASQCFQTLPRFNENLRAVLVPGATSYKFKIKNTQTLQEIESTTGRISILSFTNITPNTSYEVSVTIKINNIWLPYYGNTCVITTSDLPLTELHPTSCNGTTTRLNQNFRSNAVSYATAYRFKTTIGGNEVVVTKATRLCNMSEFPGATINQTYSIQVAIQYNGIWGLYGNACNWTVGTVGARLMNEEAVVNTSESFEIKAYPNPFSNQITLSLSNENIESNISIFDMTGKMIQTIKTSENEVNVGENLASGVYIVNITQGQETKNIRVVKQ